MDEYPYTFLGAEGWQCSDGLHRPSFPTLLQDMLHCFGFTGTPTYQGHLYREFGHGRCEVHVDIPPHRSNPSLTTWFTTATGDDLDDMLERVVHLALTQFCERHLLDTIGTPVAFFPIWDMGDPTWSERFATACDTMRQTYHMSWVFVARYARHVS
jgi:hypothetical protein